ncbi:MAG TPA: sugar phosphate isomerase/epimerase [Roseiflexaceae bacterium]|nr:sugar phosphate isomerase/epimerase [Roseiflexaceae bacterium]
MSQTVPSRVPFGVASYSFPFSCGWARRDGRPAFPEPIRAPDLVAMATEHQLSGIEIPLAGMLPDLSNESIDGLRATLQAAKLGLVADTGIVDVAVLSEQLPAIARAGAKVVRATLSSILEGARAGLPGGWDAYMAEMRQRIIELRPLLEEYDLTLALENHQDATSEDLIALCQAGGDRVGITFDVVNPLAVGEEPFAFARRAGSLIRNVHIKDYQIYPTASGYRLVRAAIGHGVIDWAAMLDLLGEVAPGATYHIELAALYGRHIRLLEDDWWQGYPPRDARELIPALRFAAQNFRPADEPWQTPWERDAPNEEVELYERGQFETSVAHLRSIMSTGS